HRDLEQAGDAPQGIARADDVHHAPTRTRGARRRAGRETDLLARAQRIAGIHAVHGGQGIHAHVVAASDARERLTGTHGLNTHAALTAVSTDLVVDTRRGQHDFRGQLNLGGYAQVRAHRQAPLGQAVQLTQDTHIRAEALRYRDDRVAFVHGVMGKA